MEIDSIVLYIHIVCGFVALVTSALSFATKKGPKAHAKVGIAYSFAMLGVGITSTILFFFGASTFLLFIGFFSTFMVMIGWRFGRNRKGEIETIDKALLGLGVIGALGLFALSGQIFVTGEGPLGQGRSFGIVPLVFGIICTALSVFLFILQKAEKLPRGKNRIQIHGIFMGSGTIATVTAFTITVLGSNVFTWLGATAIGTPLIIYNTNLVKKDKIKSDM